MNHPHLLITAKPATGFRSVDDIRQAISRPGQAQQLWHALLQHVEKTAKLAPLKPETMVEGRDAIHARNGNRDYVIVQATGQYLQDAALAALVLDDRRYAQFALDQLAVLFDEAAWPAWLDQAHLSRHAAPAGLRTGQFLRAIGFTYDWLYPLLAPADRQQIVDGLDRRAIRLWKQSVDRDDWFTRADVEPNNWQTCIMGGAGIAGMALGEDHPLSGEMVRLGNDRMHNYLDTLGPEGEFNESVGYSASMIFPIEYFAAERYHTRAANSMITDPRLAAFGRWYLHMCRPPGRTVAFGDCHSQLLPNAPMFAMLAAATGNGLFQWFYRTYAEVSGYRNRTLELLSLDPEIEPVPPENELPLGRAFRGHSAIWTSRSSWEADETACFVAGKAGHGAEKHGHHDAGTLTLHGRNRPLIVDLGKPHYPADFFTINRWEYYCASAWGHNVIMIDRQEMKHEPEDRASILQARFDDRLGGVWSAELTALYPNAVQVRRSTVHLLPGTIAVLDQVRTAEPADISLRWHTVDRAEPQADGAFVVQNEDVRLAARVISLAGEMTCRRGQHAYVPPYDKDRRGEFLPQLHEGYVEAVVHSRQATLLTLFAVDTQETWQPMVNGATIGEVRVSVEAGALTVAGPSGQLRCPLA